MGHWWGGGWGRCYSLKISLGRLELSAAECIENQRPLQGHLDQTLRKIDGYHQKNLCLPNLQPPPPSTSHPTVSMSATAEKGLTLFFRHLESTAASSSEGEKTFKSFKKIFINFTGSATTLLVGIIRMDVAASRTPRSAGVEGWRVETRPFSQSVSQSASTSQINAATIRKSWK